MYTGIKEIPQNALVCETATEKYFKYKNYRFSNDK